jgi:threonyl-tRNA synthetase
MQPESQHDNLYKIRHSFAHVLAQAVLEVRPNSKLGFGPPIEDGCYYDFDFETPLSESELKSIEKICRKIIRQAQKFEHRSLKADEAVMLLEQRGEHYKVEYCKELISRGETEIGFYKNGPFEDMCAGPHLQTTKEIPEDCFKIDSVAGAYWRGDEKRPQLTRLYCLVFNNSEELNDFLTRRKLAEERDHRKLGKELEIFTLSEDLGPGLPIWLPNGAVIRQELEKLACEMEAKLGYRRVVTPILGTEELYTKSGHLAHYKDGMYPPITIEGETNYYLRPMNCPHHHLVYKHKPRSYRDLPLRLAEFGTCHRYEPSGALGGLLRVRCFTQNDAHIYCTLSQLKKELIDTFNLTLGYLKMFRFESIQIRVSTHDENNLEKFAKNPEAWKFSEDLLVEVMKEINHPYYVGKGEAAFYGPKIDFQAKTLLGREESLATTQMDFAQPVTSDLTYIGEDGKEHRPYIVHRAPLGTHERFIGFLTEHLGGVFPTWLSPNHVIVVPVAPTFFDYAQRLQEDLQQSLVRAEADLSNNSFNKKVREAVTAKTPHILIVGGKEAESNSVTWRRYGRTEQRSLPFAEFKADLLNRIQSRLMDNFD